MPAFTIQEALEAGWEKMKAHPGPLVFCVLLYGIALIATQVPLGLFSALMTGENMPVALQASAAFLNMVVAPFLQMLVMLSFLKASLLIYRKGTASVSEVIPPPLQILQFWLASFLMGLLVFVGILFLIIPGIYIAIRLYFYNIFMVDQELGPIRSLQESFDKTRGQAGQLFLLGLVFGLLNIVGALCLLVGLFVTIPISMMATLYVYEKLTGAITPKAPDKPATTDAYPYIT